MVHSHKCILLRTVSCQPADITISLPLAAHHILSYASKQIHHPLSCTQQPKIWWCQVTCCISTVAAHCGTCVCCGQLWSAVACRCCVTAQFASPAVCSQAGRHGTNAAQCHHWHKHQLHGHRPPRVFHQTYNCSKHDSMRHPVHSNDQASMQAAVVAW